VHLAWGSQRAGVIAFGEHRARTPCNAIHRARQAGADRLHAATERVPIVRLHEQVRMIALQRVVHQAKAGSYAATTECALDLPHDGNHSERWYVLVDAHRDVRREWSPKTHARPMSHARLVTGLATGTPSTAAPLDSPVFVKRPCGLSDDRAGGDSLKRTAASRIVGGMRALALSPQHWHLLVVW
jgi:hypothetical protein